jgi:class 3 adenylate cyclase/tetratricopeptide (TPR) repeat protein
VAGLRSGTWAVLFTDLAGSTEQRARLGDAVGDALRREHDVAVARAANACGGVVVKSTGDGAMVAFSGAVDAIVAAVRIQQAIERRNRETAEPLGLRVGISLGDLSAEGDDLFGLAVNESARVCAVAAAGQILISEVVRTVAGTRVANELVDCGDVQLKGLAMPTKLWRVEWAPAPYAPLPFPARLSTTDTVRFAGRREQSVALQRLWRKVVAGRSQAALVSGEPGIGKTRLAAEVARLAHAEGGLVLYGRCEDELGIPFQPFAEALGWYCDNIDGASFGRSPAELGRLDDRVFSHTSVASAPGSVDPETAQWRLFDAAASWLRELAEEQPVMLVLDDLHWATRATLLMLRHVLEHTGDVPLLAVVTYRDTDLDRQHPLAELLPDLRRHANEQRIVLRGLDESEVLELLDTDDVTRNVAAALVLETEGNPLFVGEVLRDLTESGHLVRRGDHWTITDQVVELRIPEGVKAVIGQRLARLGDTANSVLRVAAVIGREFDTELLIAATGNDANHVLDAIEGALIARIVEEIGRDRYRFTHALVRNTLVDELSSARATRIHRSIAESIEEMRPTDASELALHWREAVGADVAEKARRYGQEAADNAMSRAAFDEAVQILSSAWDVVEDSEVTAGDQAALLEALGNAWMAAGNVQAARDAYALAAERLPDGPRLASIALAFHGPARVEAVDGRLTPLLRRALSATDADDDPATTARLHAHLALAMNEWTPKLQTEVDVAVELAERSADARARYDAYSARFWIWGPSAPVWQYGEEVLEAALEVGVLSNILDAQRLAIIGAGQHGDYERVADLARENHELAEASRRVIDRAFSWGILARMAITAGDMAEAERLTNEPVSLSDDPAIMLGWSVIYTRCLFLRDQLQQLVAHERSLQALPLPRHVGTLAKLALARSLAFSRESAEAQAILDEVATHDFAVLAPVQDPLHSSQLALLTELVTELAATSHAEQLIELVAPWRGQHLQISLGEDCGPATLHVGKLERISGRIDEAIADLEAALDDTVRGGAKWKACETRIELGVALRDVDVARATALLEEARQFAQHAQMPLLVRKAGNAFL